MTTGENVERLATKISKVYPDLHQLENESNQGMPSFSQLFAKAYSVISQSKIALKTLGASHVPPPVMGENLFDFV